MWPFLIPPPLGHNAYLIHLICPGRVSYLANQCKKKSKE